MQVMNPTSSRLRYLAAAGSGGVCSRVTFIYDSLRFCHRITPSRADAPISPMVLGPFWIFCKRSPKNRSPVLGFLGVRRLDAALPRIVSHRAVASCLAARIVQSHTLALDPSLRRAQKVGMVRSVSLNFSRKRVAG